MKAIATGILMGICLVFSGAVQAQAVLPVHVPTTMPVSAEDFKNSEDALLSLIDWVNSNPANKEPDLRRMAGKYIVTWLMNSPTVTVSLDQRVTSFMSKNPGLMVNFLGGWAKYALKHDYSKDEVQGSLMGLRSVIDVYKLGGGVKKDKDLEKLASLDEKGELEKWIAERLSKK